MREDGDGRYCERCQLRVTEIAKLDGDGLEQLLGAAQRGRVCASFELEAGRPHTKLGLAAGLVVALSGCATPTALAPQMPADPGAAPTEVVAADAGAEQSGGRIAGFVRSNDGAPLADAIVVLQSVSLNGQQERLTDERGYYEFDELPGGRYAIQVLYDQANVSKNTELPDNARFRANFTIDPKQANPIVIEVLAHSRDGAALSMDGARALPIGARARVTGAIATVESNARVFDTGFVSAGLRIAD